MIPHTFSQKIFINQSISMNPVDKNIVLGDFNCTLLISLDRKPIPNRDDIGSTELKKYILLCNRLAK
jgi:hypothetical protein